MAMRSVSCVSLLVKRGAKTVSEDHTVSLKLFACVSGLEYERHCFWCPILQKVFVKVSYR